MDEDGFLHLTDIGQEVAKIIYERHQFFTEQLIAAGVDRETAEQDACRMEPIVFNELVLSGKLHDYLADVDRQCEERQDFLMIQFMEQENVTEALKMQAQLEWVRRVNNIRNRVDEIILNEMVYA